MYWIKDIYWIMSFQFQNGTIKASILGFQAWGTEWVSIPKWYD